MAAHLVRAVSIPNKPPKKISEFSCNFWGSTTRLKFWTKIQRKSPENGHFFSIFFVLAIKFHRMNLFQNRFHRWSTFRLYFSETPIKFKLMAIYWSSHNAHNHHFGHIGHYGSTNYGHKFDLYGCPWKICSKCRSLVKTVLKKIHPTEFYGQNKKMWEKMAIFGQFPL